MFIETQKMAQQTKTTEVTNFKAITDGKKIFTQKHGFEILRQLKRRKYQLEKTEILRRAKMTKNAPIDEESKNEEEFILGICPEALYQMTLTEHKIKEDKRAIKDWIRLL